MSYNNVIKLAAQFTKKLGESERDQQFQAQRERLEEFYHKIYGQLRALVNEMEGDLNTLRHKNLDKDSYKLFSKIMYDIINLVKKIDPKKPYPGVQAFVNYATSEETEGTIEDLNFLIQLHLKRNEIDFGPSKIFKQVEINSLNKIPWIAHEAKKYMDKNPLLQEYYSVPPEVSKEELTQGPEVSIGPKDETIPPPRMKELQKKYPG